MCGTRCHEAANASLNEWRSVKEKSDTNVHGLDRNEKQRAVCGLKAQLDD